jgi:large subunit ribosomal protein L15
MQLHQIKPIHKQKAKKRVGRGGDHGHYCGQGVPKGNSRSSHIKPSIRDLMKKYPKLRGYKFKAIDKNIAVLNLSILNKKFESGEKVSPQVLAEKRLVRKIEGRVPAVKILAGGEIKKALIFENVFASESAKEKIRKAGGEIK